VDEALPAPTIFDLAAARRALPKRALDAHKRQSEVLVIAGSREYLGAALLCARGAYRSGAGLVRLALPEALSQSAAMALPEAVITALPAADALELENLEALLALASSAHAVVAGPGLGRREGTLALVAGLWKRLPQPSVFDADALFALPMTETAGGQRVLTPHEGELKHLLGADALKPGRVAAVSALAKAARCIALLKGPGTLVARPDGALSQNSTGNPALATAGSGDVLSGAIAALMAQGAEPYAAAGLGAWAHGLAADHWVQGHGGRGLLSSELADLLPWALAQAEPVK
jgi:hydroxyethylthiazole kinase-like uncharacterized protein yjeF